MLCLAYAMTCFAADGVLPGRFSVSPDKQVQFAPGNLQYRASNKVWRFAENQYDYVSGDANSRIDKNYNGWVDLFGWGTGNEPTQIAEDANAYPRFCDWGQNPILNSGNTSIAWRTLTGDEWFYLLTQRANAEQLRSQATVNNVHGYILLPDNWKLPKNILFTANANKWATNVYTYEQWCEIEKSGAVFLPAAGYRSGTVVSVVQTLGFYWSATDNSEKDKIDEARDIFFSERRIGPRDHEKRFYGLSVRLVTEVR